MLLSSGFSHASEAVFEEATEAYESGDYERCSSILDSLSVEGWYSPALYMNLGNAYFRNNRLGAAILNYEKALLLDPADEDLIHNLEVARKATYDKQEVASEKGMSIMFRAFIMNTSSNTWLWFGFIGIALSSLLILTAHIMRLKYKWTMTISGVVTLILAVFMFAFAELHTNYLSSDKAVVMSSSAAVFSEPKDNSEELFDLHEGTTVTLRDEVSEDKWVRIQLQDKSGYIKRSDIALVSLFE